MERNRDKRHNSVPVIYFIMASGISRFVLPISSLLAFLPSLSVTYGLESVLLKRGFEYFILILEKFDKIHNVSYGIFAHKHRYLIKSIGIHFALVNLLGMLKWVHPESFFAFREFKSK